MTVLIPEEKVDEIRNAADIVDIISESVILRKTGRNHIGLCPFHSEKTPSFTVSPDKQIFHCFGCGEGGNVFHFLMKHDGLSFPEALRQVARRYGVDLPERAETPEQAQAYREQTDMLAANKLTADFYHHILTKDPRGRNALAYLKNRGMNPETITHFQIGYAPDGWDNLIRCLTRKRVSLSTAEKAGLISAKRHGGYYDRFRGRIIFPIMSMSGQPIGFGGRVLDDSLPKYLNSPETMLYHKSRSLYGLYQTRKHCRDTGIIYVVEGYMDLLALYQHGIRNAAATLGTALTAEHIRLIKGQARKLVLVYDSDQAGINAARRSIATLSKDLNEYRILVLPAGHDPDSFLHAFGPEAFRQKAENAHAPIDFLMETALSKHGNSIEGKVRIISELQPYLAGIEDPVARSLYIQKLADRIDVEQKAIFEKIRASGGNSRQPLRNRSAGNGSEIDNRTAKDALMENRIIAMMLQNVESRTYIASSAALDFFNNAALKKIGEQILKLPATQSDTVSQLIAGAQSQEEKQLITQLAVRDEPWRPQGCRNLLNQFIASRKKRERKLLDEIKAAEANNDQTLLTRLLAEKQRQIQKKLTKSKVSAGGKAI